MSTTHKGLCGSWDVWWGRRPGMHFLVFRCNPHGCSVSPCSGWSLCLPTSGGGRPGSAYLGCQAGLCYLVATIHDLCAMTESCTAHGAVGGHIPGGPVHLDHQSAHMAGRFVGEVSSSIRLAETRWAAIGEEVAGRFHGRLPSKAIAMT